jgi:hypothetical protein
MKLLEKQIGLFLTTFTYLWYIVYVSHKQKKGIDNMKSEKAMFFLQMTKEVKEDIQCGNWTVEKEESDHTYDDLEYQRQIKELQENIN